VKKIRFAPNVPAEVRAIERETALRILVALHRYAETGEGDVKRLSGEFEGLLRLRVGNYRVLFEEAAETITVDRVRDRSEANR
jgi:mRNA interferase RelE/StbE